MKALIVLIALLTATSLGADSLSFSGPGSNDCTFVAETQTNIDTAFSMTAWVKPGNQGSTEDGNMVAFGGGGDCSSAPNPFILSAVGFIDNDGVANCTTPTSADGCFRVWGSTTSDVLDGVTSTTGYYEGTWYHLGLTWDGTDFKMYVDGDLLETHTPGDTEFEDNAKQEVTWGSREHSGSGRMWELTGHISRGGFWENRTLTAEEISLVYRCGPPAIAASYTEWAWWPCDFDCPGGFPLCCDMAAGTVFSQRLEMNEGAGVVPFDADDTPPNDKGYGCAYQP